MLPVFEKSSNAGSSSGLSARNTSLLMAASLPELAPIAERPEAAEDEAPALFSSGAMCLIDGRYVGVSSNLAAIWPVAEPWIKRLLELLPEKHRLDTAE